MANAQPSRVGQEFLRRSLPLIAVLAIAATGNARADDVNITTSTTAGVNLDSFVGTTASISSGVTVTNSSHVLMCSSFPAVCASTHAWTLTNNGTIGPAGVFDAIDFKAGGTIINYGTINGTNGIRFDTGTTTAATVNNMLGGLIQGNFGGVSINDTVGSVTNAGSILSNGEAVGLGMGGTVTNLSGGLIQGHGGSNAVSVILGTSRIVENSGTIQSNDSGYATGVSLENGMLTNHTGGQILGAYNGVWANGSSATSITNDGLIEANKAQSGGSAIEVDGGGTVVNTGTIRSLTTNATTTDAGISFTGAGSITNSGTILSATGGSAIVFNGSAIHTLNLNTGSVLGGNVQGGTGVDNLVLNGIGTELISKFLGFETLTMQGTEWNLTNNGTFSTSTQIQNGILHVNGQLTSAAVTVSAGGTLAGTGTIVGAVTINDGNLAPGNSIGTLNVQGSLVFAAAASYLVEVSTASADRVNVTTTAALGGATVKASFAAGAYVARQYTILNATGGVTGIFNGPVNTNLPSGFQANLSYDANNVYLNLVLNPAPNIPGGLNVNQHNVANALIGFFNATGGIPMVFGALSPFGLTMASGELPTAAQQTTFNAMDLFLGLLTDPFVAGRSDPVSSSNVATGYAGAASAYAAIYRKAPPVTEAFNQRWSVWAAGYGGSQTTDGNATSDRMPRPAGFTAARSAPTTGSRRTRWPALRWPAAAPDSRSPTDWEAGGPICSRPAPSCAIPWAPPISRQRWPMAGRTSPPTAPSPSPASIACTRKFNANTWSGRVEGGYRFVTQGFGLTPYAAGQFITVQFPSYAEQVLSAPIPSR